MTNDRLRQPYSDAEIEQLSAYIDNQLSAAERLTLERRLEREPGLRAELEDLRATATLLRELPDRRPPRSFTLDLSALPRQQRRLLLPLRWATLVATILLAVALTPDAYVALRDGAPLPAPAAQQAPTDGFGSAGVAKQGEAADTMQLPSGTAIATGPQESASNVQEAPAAAQNNAEEQPAAPAAATEAARVEPLPPGAGGPPSIDSAGGAPAQAMPYTGAEAAPGAELSEPESSSPDTAALEVTGDTPPFQPLPWWRWLQLGLAAVVVGLGAATLWARLRER
jgi:anti-sigma factor RsiW